MPSTGFYYLGAYENAWLDDFNVAMAVRETSCCNDDGVYESVSGASDVGTSYYYFFWQGSQVCVRSGACARWWWWRGVLTVGNVRIRAGECKWALTATTSAVTSVLYWS